MKRTIIAVLAAAIMAIALPIAHVHASGDVIILPPPPPVPLPPGIQMLNMSGVLAETNVWNATLGDGSSVSALAAGNLISIPFDGQHHGQIDAVGLSMVNMAVINARTNVQNATLGANASISSLAAGNAIVGISHK